MVKLCEPSRPYPKPEVVFVKSHCRQARHSTEGEQQAAAADEVLKNLRHQHEQMAAQIFGLTGEVTELKEAVTSLKEDKRVLEQRLQQQEADKATEVCNLLGCANWVLTSMTHLFTVVAHFHG